MLQKAWRRTPKGQVMLLAFYNTKALGGGIWEQTIDRELELLCEEVRRAEPVFIGLSVMTPCIWIQWAGDEDLGRVRHSAGCGGVCQLYPDYFLDRGAAYVILGRRGNSYG